MVSFRCHVMQPRSSSGSDAGDGVAGGGADSGAHVPLIMLCGWAGCQDKYLIKYAERLAELGFPSLRSILPNREGFSPFPWGRRAWAALLLREAGCHFPGRPIVMYVFSNGGAWVVQEVAKLGEASKRCAGGWGGGGLGACWLRMLQDALAPPLGSARAFACRLSQPFAWLNLPHTQGAPTGWHHLRQRTLLHAL